MTEEEYLRIEREAPYKSEYIGGRTFERASATPKQSMLAVNTASELRLQLRGKAYRLLSSDMRLRTPLTGTHLYPDLSVVRGRVQLYPGSTDIMINPSLIVDIQWTSKFPHYREFPSLRDYLVVRQDSICVEHYSRQADGSWLLREYQGADARIPLPAIGCDLHLGNIYQDVEEELSGN